MADQTQTVPITGPPGLPIIGNVSDIDAENPIVSLCNLTDIYGPQSSA
jgi:cytochrome P450/NADPH-cytochrome P450 reductase